MLRERLLTELRELAAASQQDYIDVEEIALQLEYLARRVRREGLCEGKWQAERIRAKAELIRAEDLSELKKRDHQEAFALVWDAGYEAAARFHEGDDKEVRNNPYRAVK